MNILTTDKVYGNNNIIVPFFSSDITLNWRVVSSDFPSDWLSNTGFCDNRLCYMLDYLWPSASTQTTMPYKQAATGPFTYGLNLAGASYGTHYVKLEFKSAGKTRVDLTQTQTYIVSHYKKRFVIWVLHLFPNPVRGLLTIHISQQGEDESDDEGGNKPVPKSITVTDMMGRQVLTTPVQEHKDAKNETTVDVSDLPSGTYVLRILDNNGAIIATDKFMHTK